MMLSKRSQQSAQKKNLIAYSSPDSAISDQFRTIRANLQFISKKKKQGVFLITSPGNREGKSTVAANLAVSMALQKERVLLIDASMKDPSTQSIFHIPNEAGLTNILMYDVKPEEVIQQAEVETLNIITSGSTVFSPAELIGSEAMTGFIQRIKEQYDAVIIDSPSVLHASETRMLAHQCDGVVLVINRYKTERKDIEEARKVLELAGAQVIGGIMNEA